MNTVQRGWGPICEHLPAAYCASVSLPIRQGGGSRACTCHAVLLRCSLWASGKDHIHFTVFDFFDYLIFQGGILNLWAGLASARYLGTCPSPPAWVHSASCWRPFKIAPSWQIRPHAETPFQGPGTMRSLVRWVGSTAVFGQSPKSSAGA